MSLRSKLIVAFLLLAVVPLAAITIYSYNTSIRAFRSAVEAESAALAEDMGGRMDSVRKDLSARVERLGSFPFRRFMQSGGQGGEVQSSPLMAQLWAEVGDAAPLLESIEFSPAHPETGAVRAGAPARPQLPPALPTPPADALVIHLSPPVDTGSSGDRQTEVPQRRPGRVIHIHPAEAADPAASESSEAGSADSRRLEAQLQKIQQYRVVLQEAAKKLDTREIKIARDALAEAAQAAERARQLQQANPLEGNFGNLVQVDGETVGTVTARVSAGQVFHQILSRTRRRKGEIPFVVDSEGVLHTADPKEQASLEAIPIRTSSDASAPKVTAAQSKDWVVVTRRDARSSFTYGIARPVGDGLREIRTTAVRNLGFGLGMVGLALIGVIPLSNRMTRNLTALTRGAEQLAHGRLDTRVTVSSGDEIGRLAGTFNRMAQELGEHQKRLVEQERLRKELELSRRIQEELLPRKPLQTGRVEVKGISIPAREVGGDFFNYFPLPGGEVAILVGDVAGKGIAAALLMANLQATLQIRLPLSPELQSLADYLDREIETSTPPEVYLALFMGILDTGTNELRYVNAGHNTQYALRSDGGIERLESSGRPLGLLPGGGYAESRLRLDCGDALFMYTDGLVEAENPQGNEFGQLRLESLLMEARHCDTNEILARVEGEICRHRGGMEAADDATMLVLKIGAGEA